MFERTHGSITRTILLATGWPWQDAHEAGIASMATDHATPSFIGESHLAEFPALGMPCPTSLNIDPRKTPEQIGSTWYPGWPILARWHGGDAAFHAARPIQIGDHDELVRAAVDTMGRGDWHPQSLEAQRAAIRVGMELHAAMDTATHAGFWPCYHPDNRNPAYRKAWWLLWKSAIPPILHAQYLSEVDAIEGEGRDGLGCEEPLCTKFKVKMEIGRLVPILKRDNEPFGFEAARRLLFKAIDAARNDAHFCELLDALACEIAGRELPPLAVWPRGSGPWKEFFATARGE